MVKLEDLDIDDDELDVEVPQEQEDDSEKPWMTGGEPEPYSVEDDEHEEDEEEPSEEDLVTTLLRDRGINPSSVKMLNDKGEVEEKDFNDLTREEQLQILNYSDSDDNYGLEPDEIEVINFMRQNRMDSKSYQNYIAQQAIKNYLENNQQEPTYEIDSIPDDELFILDLKAKIEDLTQEEAIAELEAAKQNESLYAKKIQGLRALYKKREDEINAQEAQEQEAAQRKQAEEYEKVIVEAIQRNDSIDLGDSSITFSEDDMNELASFILDSDAAGVRHIAKALNDPQTLIGMAWYALHGKETFGQVADYYKKKITEASKYNYQKGYEDARNGKKPNSNKTSTVRKPAQQQSNKQPKVLTIDDLD